ncbi:hypothetical protein L596_012554 [Steinernema carpocapsae]|nr:hypothetical protein L596_012554 [Steinernema carpocapsae]
MFGFILGPGILLGINEVILTAAIEIAIVCAIQSLLSNLLIAVNRCLLITVPFTFKNVFARRNTLIMIVVTWLFTVGSLSPGYFMSDCLPPIDANGTDHEFFTMTPSLSCEYLRQTCIFTIVALSVTATLASDFFAIYKLCVVCKVRHLTLQIKHESFRLKTESHQ